MAHNQKRRGQNTTPASHRKTRNPTPTPRKRGRARPQGTPHGRGDCNNRRTNARTSPEPRNHRRESPQKVGEKTCTVHMKAKRPKRHEKTRKDKKKDEKARTIQQRGHKAEKGSAVQDCPPNSSAAQETAKPKRGGAKPKSDQVARKVRHVLKDRTQLVPT